MINSCVTCSRVNLLWPSDAIWQQRSGSTLAQVMTCCLTAPSHYLNQCWLIISEVQWHSYWGNFTRDASTINHWNPFESYIFKISFKFPRGQWVNYALLSLCKMFLFLYINGCRLNVFAIVHFLLLYSSVLWVVSYWFSRVYRVGKWLCVVLHSIIKSFCKFYFNCVQTIFYIVF